MNKKLFDTLRYRKHMTLEQLSEKTGIPVSTLTKISAGYVKTSFHNMCLIAKALECSLDEFTENCPSAISDDDRKLLHKYHQLNNYGKNVAQMLLDMNLLHQKNDISTSYHQIFCIHPTIYQGDTFTPNCYTMEPIMVPDQTLYGNADFALQIPFHNLSPVFCLHDTLYLHYRFPGIGEIGLFQSMKKIFFGRVCPGNEGLYLKPVQFDSCPPKYYDQHSINCLGTVYAIQHTAAQLNTQTY